MVRLTGGGSIARFRSEFIVLPESPGVLDELPRLVVRHDLRGERIHDAHLLATLIADRIPSLLTADPSDFPVEPAVAVLTPREVAEPPSPVA